MDMLRALLVLQVTAVVPAALPSPAIQNPNAQRAPEIQNRPGVVPAAVVTFRPAAQVRGRAIHLSDVALIESAVPGMMRRLGAIDVGSAPLWGYSRPVSAEYARVRIRQAGLDPAEIQFAGSPLITVTRPEQLLSGTALRKAAVAAVEAANPGVGVELTFEPRDLHLPVGRVLLSTDSVRMAGDSAGTVSVQVRVEGQLTATIPVSFRLQRMAPAVVAVRDLPAGTVLTAADLRVEDRPVVPGPLLLSDAAAALGQQVALPIKGGTALTGAMVKPAVLVRRGAPVRLICRGPGFVATVAGEALQDGAAGQFVRCRNLSSLREVTGVVVGDETAEVPF